MFKNRTIVQGMYNREMGYPNICLRACAILKNVQRMRPIYELRHFKTENERVDQNYISSIRFNCKGNMVASSLTYGDNIDLWGWTNNKSDITLRVGCCSVSRFDWLPYDAERLILAVDKCGHMRMLDLVAQVSNFVWCVRSPGISYDLHARLPHCVTIADNGGAVSSLDFRCGRKTTIMEGSKDGSPTFDIHWLGINPQRYYEFCIAGNNDELRIYDRRNTSKIINKLSTTISNALNPCKDYG